MTGQQIDRDRLRELADEYDDSTIDGGPDVAAGAIRQLLEALDQAEAERDKYIHLIGVLAEQVAAREANQEQVRAALDRVRELHQPCNHDAPCRGDCAECGQHMPCDTIRALDGEQ